MKRFVIITCSLLFLLACQKEDSEVFIECNSIDYRETTNVEAVRYYTNLNKIIKSLTLQQSLTKETVEQTEYFNAEYYLEHEEEYPMLAKLATIDVELEDGSIITYFDLPDDEKEEFLNEYTTQEALALSAKIEVAPEIEWFIKEENRIIEEAMECQAVITKDGLLSINDPKSFLAAIRDKIDSLAFMPAISNPETKLGYSNNKKTVPYEKVLRIIANVAKRGDVIVALPNHDNPMCLIDFGNKKYMVGHAEIFTRNITQSTRIDDLTTVGAWVEDGVSRKKLENWCYKSYVVGICHYKVKWKWRGFKSHFYSVKTPVSNPAALASKAESYIGHSYVHWYEFLTPKWAAPARFTCTSLVWWCAKKEYGEKISPWYSTIVTPSDVLTDNNTYLKATIE